MSSKPTLVLVPGAWHIASTWNKISSLLEAQGYKCSSLTLPSANSNPSATYLDDINAVRDAITAETTQGRDVVLVVHSYGGHVGNSAIKGLTKPKQDSSVPTNKSSGFVVGVAMIASGFPITGVAFLDGFGGKPPPYWKADEETGFLDLLVDIRELFYHDLPIEEGEYWVSKLEKQALRPLTEGEHSYAGWKDVPVWFLATTEDKALPFEAQKFFVQTARDAGADVTVREVESSHSPMLSKPQETVDFLLEAAASFAK
ncbi:Methylesterase [Lachnellula suecica]|uniref:Methylesterase n=1 Tax=Lachnellula suecica TaxID=602035 RepID=A0A8T9CA14_9HELO|nr:Methylesterase [Lachnellula suecica]